MIRGVPRPLLITLAAVGAAALLGSVVRLAVLEAGRQVVADPVSGFWFGTVLAGVAWLPVTVHLARRWRTPAGYDGWFYAAVAWGVLLVAAVAVPVPVGAHALSGAPSWLLVETIAFWTGVSVLLTRRRSRP